LVMASSWVLSVSSSCGVACAAFWGCGTAICTTTRHFTYIT
jgi:hypothetical protein